MPAPIKLAEVLQFLITELKRLAARIDGVDYTNNNLPRRDPTNQLTSSRIPTSTSYRLVSGSVVDVIGTTGWYSVQTDDNSYVSCNCLKDTAFTIVGAKSIGAIHPGSRVFLILNEVLRNGTIIGVIPVVSTTDTIRIHDYISQVSTNNMLFDTFLNHHQFRIPTPVQYETNSPIDETAVGEWGKITESGVALFIDSFMAFLRADENCGFWAFWHDQLARMQGHNLQIRSPAFDLNSFNDEDELSVVTGTSPYLWEALGLFKPGAVANVSSEQQVAQVVNAEKALADLKKEGQTPFHRFRKFEGYLGQGFKKQLRLPPKEITADSIHDLEDPKTGPAVWEEHLALDGNYHIVSSQGIFIAHAPLFQTPVQKKTAEDPTGDTRKDGYSFNDAKLKPGPNGNTEIDGIGPALTANDELAYGMQWRSAHPFYYHKKDWQLSNDGTYTLNHPQFSSLSDSQYLNKPSSESLDVDDREKQASFYKTLSFLSILRDGTVVIAGPGGEEIRMGGGNIEISCPGDIQLRPGRSCVTIAGRDAITRANQNVELSANTQDVRIKSERNMQLLAGNSGVGGLLLESKSEGEIQDYSNIGTEVYATGITFKSKTFVSSLSRDVYLRTYDTGAGAGQIILDAGAIGSDIITKSSNFVSYALNSVQHYFGPAEEPVGADLFNATQSRLSGGITANDNSATFINGALATKGNVVIVDGHVASTAKMQFVGTIEGESLAEIRNSFEDVKVQIDDLKVSAATQHGFAFVDRLYAEKRIGNEDTINQIGFSFRSSDQYKVGKFTLFESRWAQIARTAQQTSSYWQEKIVKANEQSTMPYPGFDVWIGSNSYCQVDNKLYTKTGPLPTGQVYEQAEGSEVSKTTAEGNYPVIS